MMKFIDYLKQQQISENALNEAKDEYVVAIVPSPDYFDYYSSGVADEYGSYSVYLSVNDINTDVKNYSKTLQNMLEEIFDDAATYHYWPLVGKEKDVKRVVKELKLPLKYNKLFPIYRKNIKVKNYLDIYNAKIEENNKKIEEQVKELYAKLEKMNDAIVTKRRLIINDAGHFAFRNGLKANLAKDSPSWTVSGDVEKINYMIKKFKFEVEQENIEEVPFDELCQ